MGVLDVVESIGYLFYVVNPKRTSFETIDEVPDYTKQVIPYFIILLLLEQWFLKRTKNKSIRVNDAICSMSQGILSEISGILLGGWKIAAYIYIYENWSIMELPWDSIWTWFICFLAVDFLYYWAHRASHEVNFLWAAHQVHHSSEDYNLSTALRQSTVQSYLLSIFYLPMALAIPPSVFLVHSYFNLLYQFWIHTEMVKSLGPLEYILNTASHHRVHHGRNRYCIDKNYAGTLIIWDRLFGTFEPEGEEVVYGLTHPIDAFEPFYIQLCHFKHIWKTFCATIGWRNKLSVVFKGPGWDHGKPRLGCIEDIPDVKAPIQKFDPYLPNSFKRYISWHFFILILGFVEIAEAQNICPPTLLYGTVLFEVYSLFTIGLLLESKEHASRLELLRCVLYFVVESFFLPYTRLFTLNTVFRNICLIVIRLTFTLSGIYWIQYCIKFVISLQSTKNKHI